MNLEELFEEAQRLRNNNQADEAVAKYRQVKQEALKIGNKWLATESQHQSGVALYQVEKFDEAQELLNEALEEARKLGDQTLVGATLRDLAMVARGQKNLEKAQELYLESMSVLSGHLGISQVKYGKTLVEAGKLEDGEKQIRAGLALCIISPDKFFTHTSYFDLAQVLFKAGKKDEAREALGEAAKILDEISAPDQFQPRRKQMAGLKEKLV
ncbi:tetratricopeptide repeat protein [Candidatus Daviesbacteria bacterium]|nr:tetratricopeptide repeat protein [Candidatus Daviesbacteria bacterium]